MSTAVIFPYLAVIAVTIEICARARSRSNESSCRRSQGALVEHRL